MYTSKYRKAALVFTLSMIFFCLAGTDCWSKDYSPNVHWVFCIDTSGSMKLKGQRDLLKLITQRITNEFADPKKKIIKTGDRITIFSFDEKVKMEATALYQTENDILPIREKLKLMNNRKGSLTFISEAIVQAIDLTNKYSRFFHTNALYVFTDGKSEPYSPKWPKKKIAATKARDAKNFKKISLFGKNNGLNIWLGVLKWDAFDDAKSLVKNIGKGGHLVDLTDFNRLSIEKALNDFAQTVRPRVTVSNIKDIDFGTIPYKSTQPYEKNISLNIQTDKIGEAPSIAGHIKFDPDNPSEISQDDPLNIDTAEEKMVLNFRLEKSDRLKPGIYRGKLELLPSQAKFGALEIVPSQFKVEFKKSSYTSFYVWRVLVAFLICFTILFFLVNKIKRKMPIRV